MSVKPKRTRAEINRENGKKGGRRKGKLLPKTLEKMAVINAFKDKVMQSADVLFRSQLHLAVGLSYLYKIEKDVVTGPKGGKTYVKRRPELVTSQMEIENYLMGLCEEGDPDDENDPAATYYFITTRPPDNKAIDSMLDRTFDKASQPLKGDPDDPDGTKFVIVGMKIIKE